MTMTLFDACRAVAEVRGHDAVLISTMGAMYAFDRLAQAADDEQGRVLNRGRLSSVPLMGGAAGLGLGLALAQPARPLIVVDGDASLMLELSVLATVAVAAPARFLHIVIRNGTQFTGLANLRAPHQGFDFAKAAADAGYAGAETIADVDVWRERLPALMRCSGPVLVQLEVEPIPARTGPGYVPEQMPDLQFERMGREAVALAAYLQGGTP